MLYYSRLMNCCALEVFWGRNWRPVSATITKMLIFTFCTVVTGQPSPLRRRNANLLVVKGVRQLMVRPLALHHKRSIPRSLAMTIEWERRVKGGVTIVSPLQGVDRQLLGWRFWVVDSIFWVDSIFLCILDANLWCLLSSDEKLYNLIISVPWGVQCL